MITYTAVQAIREMYKYISKNKQDWIYISSYGIWAGVSEKPHQKHNKHSLSYEFMDLLNSKARKYNCLVDILVGVDYGNTNGKRRLYKTQCEFDKIKFHKITNCHAKYILCSDGYCMIGSANLSDSHWYDVAIIQEMDQYYVSKLKEAHEKTRNTGVSAWRCK